MSDETPLDVKHKSQLPSLPTKSKSRTNERTPANLPSNDKDYAAADISLSRDTSNQNRSVAGNQNYENSSLTADQQALGRGKRKKNKPRRLIETSACLSYGRDSHLRRDIGTVYTAFATNAIGGIATKATFPINPVCTALSSIKSFPNNSLSTVYSETRIDALPTQEKICLLVEDPESRHEPMYALNVANGKLSKLNAPSSDTEVNQ